MRYIKNILIVLSVVIESSCIEDNGNYVYQDSGELFSLEITGLPEKASIMVGETLNLSPQIDGLLASTNYKYEWYAWEENISGRPPKRINLSEKKNLELKIALEPRSWLLFFKVTDTNLNVYERAEVKLTVKGCPVSKGWYILEDDGENTNIDYIDLENNLEYSDVLSGRIPGKARTMVWEYNNYRHNITDENGNVTISVTPAFHILTDQTAHVYDGNTLKLLKTFDELFYSAPNVCNPQNIKMLGDDLLLINGNKVYTIVGRSSNIGKYGTVLPGSYELYPDLFPGSNLWLFGFNQKEHSFCQISAIYDSYTPIKNATIKGENIALSNMTYDVVMAGGNSVSDCPTGGRLGQAFFLMKHLEKNEYKLLGEKPNLKGWGVNTYSTFSDVPSDSKLIDASIISPSLIYDFFYFVADNTLYSYSFNETAVENREKQVFSCPENEKIAVVRTINEGNTVNVVEKTLVIITNTDDGHWKLYKFAIQNPTYPEINPTPESIYTGEGYAKYFMYRNIM